MKRCSVCGDTCQTNVKMKWRRFKDNMVFDVCCLCAEGNKANENSVEKYGDPVPYDETTHGKPAVKRPQYARYVMNARRGGKIHEAK